MSRANIFWPLVRHELKFKGNSRKRNRTPVARWWWIIYIALLLIAGICAATWFALHHTLQLTSMWYAFSGFPYLLFFLGFGIQKQETENDTYGWWLTLPYPRTWLVGAKWVAAWLRMLMIVGAVYVLISGFGLAVTACLDFYTWKDFSAVAISGLNWLILLVGFGPLILSCGFLTASSMITAIRPIVPVLWVVFMGGSGFSYSGMNWLFAVDDTAAGALGINRMDTFFPFPAWSLAAMAASWLLAYLVMRLSAYLLDKKIAL